ncbi:MAG TPA: hypothetical protein VIL55_03010 [Naasia sp.]|jgi:hypothetical protein
MADDEIPPGLLKAFDRLLDVQRPLVLAHIRGIRRKHPNATPEQIIGILERRYLLAVTTGGAATGASAAVPGVGTAAALALSGAETAGFLEASALFAQAVTEVHGIAVTEPERARSLVMALMLGSTGKDLVKQFAGQFGPGAVSRNAYWGELVTSRLPKAMVNQLTDRLKRAFVRRFALRQGGSIMGRLIPFGVGAVIGGAGNRMLGNRVIQSAREAFPPPPLQLTAELEPRDKAVHAHKRWPGLVNLRKSRRSTPELTAGTPEE